MAAIATRPNDAPEPGPCRRVGRDFQSPAHRPPGPRCETLSAAADAILRDQQDVPQRWQLCVPLLHLAPVQTVGSHEHLAFANADACGDRLRAEGREERRHLGAVLQCAENRDIEFGNAPGEHEHAIALADAKLAQHMAKRFVRRASSPKLRSSGAALRETKRRAVRSFKGPAACRSTASKPMLSPPPGRPWRAARAASQLKARHSPS